MNNGLYNGLTLGVANGVNNGLTPGNANGTYGNDFKVGIVTAGLVFNVDANIFPSYPKTGANWRDLTGQVAGSTLFNTPTYNNVKVGSLTFNSTNQYANFGNATALSFTRTSSFSVSIWLKASSASVSRNVFSKQLNSGAFTGWGLGTNASGAYQVFLYSNTGIIIDFPVAYNDNQWHHIGFTYDGSVLASGVTLYHNGQPIPGTVIIDTLGANNIVSSANVQFNGRGGAANLWSGSVSCIQVYNRRLSPGEMMQNYIAQKTRFGY